THLFRGLHRDLEHAVLALRLDVFRVGIPGKGDRPFERAIDDFAIHAPAVAVVLVRVATFALDREAVAFDGNVVRLAVDAGYVEPHHEVAFAHERLERGNPAAGRHAGTPLTVVTEK